MYDENDLERIEQESGGDCGCGCGGSTGAAPAAEASALDPAALLRELEVIDAGAGGGADDLALALGDDLLAIEDELEFAAAVDDGGLDAPDLRPIMELIQANPGLKITLGY